MSTFHLKTTSFVNCCFLSFPPNIFLPVVFVCAILVVNNKHRCLLGSGGEKTKMEPALSSSLSLSLVFLFFSFASPLFSVKAVNKNNNNNL